MKKQTYEALTALAEALVDDMEAVDELKAYDNLPIQVIVATFDYAKEHAE